MKKAAAPSILSVVVLLGVAVITEAQQQAKVAKIGILEVRSPSDPARGAESFRREFSALGYVEGKNIAFEHRFADNKRDRLPALAEELVRLKVDILVVFDNSAARYLSSLQQACLILSGLGWLTALHGPEGILRD
jgi:hypothetical protein